MKRLFRNKKAVSPVIATVLMILVTMAGMSILFGFVISYSDSYKKGVGSSVMESLTVEDIWLSPPPNGGAYNNQVQIWVYNAGKIDSTITSIYADGAALTENGNFNLKEPIAVGHHLNITLTYSINWVRDHQYTFRISTLRGSNFDVTYKAP
jgi:flagellin-like protein